MPAIGTPVRKAMTNASRMKMNGSVSTSPRAYAHRSPIVATAIPAAIATPIATARSCKIASFSMVKIDISTRPMPSQIPTKPELILRIGRSCDIWPPKNEG